LHKIEQQQIDVPDRLMKSRDQIVDCAVKQPKQKFTPSKWKDELGKPKYHLDVMADLNYIVDRFPCGLDRNDLEYLAQEAPKIQVLSTIEGYSWHV